jgi:SAM-dependent methyltransferase
MSARRPTTKTLHIWQANFLAHRYLWPNMSWAVETALRQTSDPRPLVLDVGCVHKPYADLFQGCSYRGMDCTTAEATPDIVADAAGIPLKTATVDIVFSSQVIEHVPDPRALVGECRRVLKPDAFLILTGPFYRPLHEEPHDYFHFTKYGLEHLLRATDFSEWEIRPDGGDWALVFLSISLRLQKRWLVPSRMVSNVAGMLLDRLDYRDQSPANYTIMARA